MVYLQSLHLTPDSIQLTVYAAMERGLATEWKGSPIVLAVSQMQFHIQLELELSQVIAQLTLAIFGN